jgi:acetyl esterase
MTTDERDRLIQRLRQDSGGDSADERTLNLFQVKKTDTIIVPTRNGNAHIFIHYPEGGIAPYPLLVNIHGGGFIKGHRGQDTVFCRNMCSRAGCAVIDIDYTPVPEQRYPYALHQCYDVVKWASDNSVELGVDSLRIALCGHSAGGNLAAAISLINNEKRDFKILLQILDYPCLDLHTPPQLKRDAYKNPKLPPEIIRLVEGLYVDDDQRLLPTVSPCFAPDNMLTGLPETLIITCYGDYLGQEAESYALKLLEAGVPVTARRFLESGHGFVVRRNGQFEEAEAMILQAMQKVYKTK